MTLEAVLATHALLSYKHLDNDCYEMSNLNQYINHFKLVTLYNPIMTSSIVNNDYKFVYRPNLMINENTKL